MLPEQELSLATYIRRAAALYYGLPPKEVGMHKDTCIGRHQVK